VNSRIHNGKALTIRLGVILQLRQLPPGFRMLCNDVTSDGSTSPRRVKVIQTQFKTTLRRRRRPDQIRKLAIRAQRIGLVAEVVKDLQQALLAGGGVQANRPVCPQQSVPGQAQQ
jgi:hypothetical protein